MDLRTRYQYHRDRLVCLIDRHLPRPLGNALLAEVETALRAPARKKDFMRFADSFQSRMFELFLQGYGTEPFAKLLALKLSNLAVAQYHYRRRHSVLVSRPVQLTVDPTNACQLGCPACVHTTNAPYAAIFDWPRQTLPVETHDRFLAGMGPFALSTLLYNYGEPLLHKQFSKFVQSAKKYLLFVHTSTNLSMPLSDPDELVNSGLDRMVLSIDGTTQETYERYRRNGNLELVFENVRKLVAARKRSGLRTPYLCWQFLTFDHNAHQTADAIARARELGVNEILVETPFAVDSDAPDIRAVTVRERGRHVFEEWDGNWCSAEWRRGAGDAATAIDDEFGRSWEQRFVEEGQGKEEESRSGAPTCDWLYQNVTLDGAARIMPCCMAPEKSGKRLVFANFGETGAGTNLDPVNTPMGVRSRLAFADRAEYDAEVGPLTDSARPFCAECQEKPPPYHLDNIGGDIRALDDSGVLPRSLAQVLTDWKC